MSPDRSDEQHLAAVARALHVLRRGLRLKHRGLQIREHHVVVHRLGDLVRLLFLVAADAIDEDVEAAEILRDPVHHALDIADGSRVEPGRTRSAPSFRNASAQAVAFSSL